VILASVATAVAVLVAMLLHGAALACVAVVICVTANSTISSLLVDCYIFIVFPFHCNCCLPFIDVVVVDVIIVINVIAVACALEISY